jgi:DnaJ-class molecular chaperone
MQQTLARARVTEAETVTCAFCRGSGRDPFDLLSDKSRCAVCGGRGRVVIGHPAKSCAFCGGSGVFPRRRLTCTVCAGAGVVTVPEPARVCGQCLGAGRMSGTFLPCSLCGGKGCVASTSRVRSDRSEPLQMRAKARVRAEVCDDERQACD